MATVNYGFGHVSFGRPAKKPKVDVAQDLESLGNKIFGASVWAKFKGLGSVKDGAKTPVVNTAELVRALKRRT